MARAADRQPDLSADLIVLGGGMAGMCAAGHAAARGASVCLIEKGGELGGSAVLSGGWVWTAMDYHGMREHVPDGDAELQRVFLERYPIAVDWIRSTGVEVGSLSEILWSKGYRIDILGLVSRCEALVRSTGGSVLRSTITERLITERGKVAGVVVRSEGETAVIRGRAVLLATGGFQASPSLLYEQFGENSRKMLLRSNPHSSGDGLRLGLSVGADTSGDMSTFYGHPIAWPLVEFLPKDFARLTAAFLSVDGLLVNLRCERFTDESFGHQANAIAIAKQPSARAVVLTDGRTADSAEPKLTEFAAAGAHVARAESIAGLAARLAEWGFDTCRLRTTIDDYNAMIRGSTSATPARRWNRNPFGLAPVYAFEVTPGITATQGGLRVDAGSRVLDPHGQPIPGLFAAGADAGGFCNGGYAGSLSVACVFGLTAAEMVVGPSLFPDMVGRSVLSRQGRRSS